MNKKLGKLYGVGVGPGAPDLLTLRASNIINAADVLAIPVKDDTKRSFAYEICEPSLKENSEQEKLHLLFPMTKNADVLIPAWNHAVKEIKKRLFEGKDVAFITEGDPSVYSTWSYLLDDFKEQMPELEIEIVPGITSVTAIAAITTEPLVDGEERFAVVPATYGIGMLPELIKEFDTIVLMKVGRKLSELVKLLRELNLLEKATLVTHATTHKQEIYEDLSVFENEDGPYFSIVTISLRNRKGILSRIKE